MLKLDGVEAQLLWLATISLFWPYLSHLNLDSDDVKDGLLNYMIDTWIAHS